MLKFMRTTCSAVIRLVIPAVVFYGFISSPAQEHVPDMVVLRAAARNGDLDAQIRIAGIYMVRGEYPVAVDWYRKAANQGSANAQYQLGQLLMNGMSGIGSRPGISKNQGEAIQWYLRAAKQGHEPSQRALGTCYANGTSVNQDIVEAYKWFRVIALETSSSSASDMLNSLILAMTDQQVADGEKRAKDWLVNHPVQKDSSEGHAKGIALNGILAKPDKRMAIINSHTFEKGEEARILVGQKMLNVKCVDIKEKSAIILVEGSDRPKEIELQ
jgi:uncharacterized protein